MVFSKKNRWIGLVIIMCILAAKCFASSNDENSLSPHRPLPLVAPAQSVGVGVDGGVDAPNPVVPSSMLCAQRILAVTVVGLELSIESLPFVLSCLSDKSDDYALASLGQNALYASMYALSLAKDSCSQRTSLSNLLRVINLANCINSSIAAFACWRYYATLESDYRLINMVFNGVVGAVTFPLKILARKNLLNKLWHGRFG